MTKSFEMKFKQAEAFIAGYHAGWNDRGAVPGELFDKWFRDQESKREPGANAPIGYDQKTAAFIAGYHAGWNAERSGPGPGKLFEDWFRDQERKRVDDAGRSGESPTARRRGTMKIGDEICWCPYGAGGKLPPHDVRGIPVETGSLPSFIIGTIETLGKTKNGQRPTAIRDDLGRVWDMTSGGDVFVRSPDHVEHGDPDDEADKAAREQAQREEEA